MASLTAAECLSALTMYRSNAYCHDCARLDYFLAYLQGIGDYGLACEAAALRVADDRLHSPYACTPCPPRDAFLAWLQPTSPSCSGEPQPAGAE
jgi:hypothetical protein